MKIVHVPGEDHGEIMLYTLSTCVWCRKMKKWLNERGYAYSYVDVDQEKGPEKKVVMDEVRHWNPACSFPTIVVNGETCLVGFKPEKLKELISR